MATSNQMFDRVERFLEANRRQEELMLQHGKAALNDQFEQLKYAARVYDDEKQPSAVVAEEWFAANKKHGLLAPYGVGTIDQALLAVLQTKHVFVRLFGLAGKCVILDEVHAYDAYMTTLMERLLRWLAALGCPVVLLSATLPRDKRLKLLRAYAGDAPGGTRTTALPARHRRGGRRPSRKCSHVEADPDRARTVRLGWLTEGDLADTLRAALAGGGCAAVIRNTVGLAQETYRRLRDALKNDGIVVELFHARFPFGRRQEIENAVLKRFGKSGGPAERRQACAGGHPGGGAVPRPGLRRDGFRPGPGGPGVAAGRPPAPPRARAASAGVAETRLWLIEPGEKDGLPDFGRSEYVYARFVLLRSHLALKAVEQIRLPDDLEHSVEQVYGVAPLTIPEGWQTALAEAERTCIEKQENQQLNVWTWRCDPDQAPWNSRASNSKKTIPKRRGRFSANQRRGPVRSTRGHLPHRRPRLPRSGRVDSIRRGQGTQLRTASHHPQQRGVDYAPRVLRLVRLAQRPTSWRKKGMLRHHRIARVDGSGRSLPGNSFLLVDPELGIRFTEY